MVSTVKEKGWNRLSVARSFLASSYASLVSRVILGAVFLVSGSAKVLDPGALAASIRSYELSLPEWFISLSAYSLPYLEVLIGFYLLIGLFTKVSAWTMNGLMVLFILALVQGALRGLEIDCGCFGSSANGEPGNLWLDAARDFGLLTLGLHIALAPAGRFSMDARLRREKTRQQVTRDLL